MAAQGTYKSKVVKHKANKAALVISDSRNLLIQTMFGKDDNPCQHNEYESGDRRKLELYILNEGHHGKRNNHCRR